MTNVRTTAVLTALFCAAISTTAFAAEPTTDSLPTVKKNVAAKKAVLVDVREQSEWDDGHISGAVFLPLSELKNGVTAAKLAKQLSKTQIVYTHCVAGVRSCTAADVLKKFGYQVRPLEPGYEELLEAGFKKAKD